MFVLAAFSATDACAASDAGESENRKAVLITGASTGIGRHAAETLAAAGYFVYAGARKPADIEALSAIDNIMGIRLDVTSQDEIDAAVALIESQGRGLWGVVNNAGVNVVAPTIEFEEEDLDFLFDVNIYGVWRVTKSFAPMIIESKGRIVNISSISGVLASGGYSAYAMSKHAVEAMTDSMQREMPRVGVFVAAIEPGNFNSQIGITRCERMLAENRDHSDSYFPDFWEDRFQSCKDYLADPDSDADAEPDAVSAAIEHALFSDAPKQHYMVVPNREEGWWTISKAFEELLWLNEDHEHSFTREELIDIMDEELRVLRGGERELE